MNNQELLKQHEKDIRRAIYKFGVFTGSNQWDDVYQDCVLFVLTNPTCKNMYSNLMHVVGDSLTVMAKQVHFNCHATYSNHQRANTPIDTIPIDVIQLEQPKTQENRALELWGLIENGFTKYEKQAIEIMFASGKKDLKTIKKKSARRKSVNMDYTKLRQILMKIDPSNKRIMTQKSNKLVEAWRFRMQQKAIKLLNATKLYDITQFKNYQDTYKPHLKIVENT